MTDLERAMLDIAEVRDRLAMTQRFGGISGVAAIASGCFAIAAGVLQVLFVAVPSSGYEHRIYASIWLVCGTAAMIVNYASIAHWFVSDTSVRDRWQTRTVGLAILPAIALGAGSRSRWSARWFPYLPGVWYGCYGVGLFASRMMLPRDVSTDRRVFLAGRNRAALCAVSIALAWWVCRSALVSDKSRSVCW